MNGYRCWENLKRKLRDEKTQDRNEALKTGGGPGLNRTPNPIMAQVEAIVPYINTEVATFFFVFCSILVWNCGILGNRPTRVNMETWTLNR